MEDKNQMDAPEEAQETALQPADEAPPEPEDGAGAEEAQGAQEDGDDGFEKLFSVEFDISADELYNFQVSMGAQQIEKSRKSSRIVGIVEIVLGICYLGAILLGKVPPGAVQYLLSVALLALGIYGLLNYRYFFYPSLRRSVNKQHGKVPYFNSRIRLDVYPNRGVECFGEKETPNYWRSIQGVVSSPDAFYIRLDAKHCLLVPKRCAGEELGPFLRQMCSDFEKDWKEA